MVHGGEQSEQEHCECGVETQEHGQHQGVESWCQVGAAGHSVRKCQSQLQSSVELHRDDGRGAGEQQRHRLHVAAHADE